MNKIQTYHEYCTRCTNELVIGLCSVCIKVSHLYDVFQETSFTFLQSSRYQFSLSHTWKRQVIGADKLEIVVDLDKLFDEV